MLFAVLTLVVLATGTGFVLFVVYFAAMSAYQASRQRSVFANVFRLATVMFLSLGAAGGFVTEGFTKFSFDYAYLILGMKVSRVESFTSQGFKELLLGGQVSLVNPVMTTTGDFGYLGMISSIGLLGAALVLGAPLLFARSLRGFIGPTVLFILSFVHYPALSSPPGAVLFALYLYMLASHIRVDQRQAIVTSASGRVFRMPMDNTVGVLRRTRSASE